MASYMPSRRFVVGVIYLQFESKENKVIIRSFSKVYVGTSRGIYEDARLESVYTGNRIVGSNPTLSAKDADSRVAA